MTPAPSARVHRAAIYCRVSTHDQQTLPMQLEACREFCARRGWEVVQEVTEAASGAKVRPARNALLEDARRRSIDAVVVWKLDRWGRSTGDLITSLEELAACDVVFASVTEAIDLSTPAGRALVGMLSVFANFERDMIRERVRAGVSDRRKKAGGKWGRPKVSEERRARIVQMHEAGVGVVEISRVVGVAPNTVRTYVRNDVP